jgi:hypothetical protein
MIGVSKCNAADRFARKEERGGANYAKNQADPTEGEYGGSDQRLAARAHSRRDLANARGADPEVDRGLGQSDYGVRMANTFVRSIRINITITVEPPIIEVDFSASACDVVSGFFTVTGPYSSTALVDSACSSARGFAMGLIKKNDQFKIQSYKIVLVLVLVLEDLCVRPEASSRVFRDRKLQGKPWTSLTE